MYSRSQETLRDCADCLQKLEESEAEQTPLQKAVQNYIDAADAALPGVLRIRLALLAIQRAESLGDANGFTGEQWFFALKAARPDLVDGDSLNQQPFIYDRPEQQFA